MLIDTSLNTKLWKHSGTTVRTWLLLLKLSTDHGNPLVMSITEIKQFSAVSKPISHRAVSKALDELEGLGMIEVDRRGNVSIIRVITGHGKRKERGKQKRNKKERKDRNYPKLNTQ